MFLSSLRLLLPYGHSIFEVFVIWRKLGGVRYTNSTTAAWTQVSVQSVPFTFLAFSQEPDHYFSLLRIPCPTSWEIFAMTSETLCSTSSGLRSAAICVFFPYSRVESFSPLIFALPPVGSARVSPQTLHVTLFVALPKSCCSFPHFRHLTRKKLLRGLGISLFQSLMFCFASLLYG